MTGRVLQGDTEATQEVGALLWPRLAAAYVEKRLAPHPPADGAAGAVAYDRLSGVLGGHRVGHS